MTMTIARVAKIMIMLMFAEMNTEEFGCMICTWLLDRNYCDLQSTHHLSL